MENDLCIADNDRVTRVGSSLVPRNDIDTLAEKIDYFSLPFVAPLCTNDDFH